MKTIEDLPLLLTADEAAELLRTSRAGIYAMVSRAEIPGVKKIGRRVRFERDVLLDWIGLSHESPARKGR